MFDANRRPARILIADPDGDMRLLYRTSLRLAGCEVVDATDGRDALVKALLQPPPTLVIAETRLPFIDGYALCELLRRDVMTRTVPILIVTAEPRPELDRARDAGADGVLIKPVSPEALLREIQRLLRRPTEPSDQSGTPKPPDRRLTERRRTPSVKAHSRSRVGSQLVDPPDLFCPSCQRTLTHERSHVGGVNSQPLEQWDDYSCPASCGSFVYRHHTRQLRRAAGREWRPKARR